MNGRRHSQRVSRSLSLALTQAVNRYTLRDEEFGIAILLPVRSRQADQGGEGPAIPAEKYIDLCKSFGGDGCQMAFSQLVSTDEDSLKRVRRALEDKGMFLELSLGGKVLADAEEFARVASVAQQWSSSARVAINGAGMKNSQICE